MELILYIIIGIIWAIATLIQKALKQNQNVNRKKTTRTSKNNKSYTKKSSTPNRTNNDEEEIFRRLQKNIKDLKNITDEETVYTTNYERSNNDREILELQEKYNSKIEQINTIKNNSNNDTFNSIQMDYNKIHVNNMLSSLDIKNAIIYNAILEPKRINYIRKQRVE